MVQQLHRCGTPMTKMAYLAGKKRRTSVCFPPKVAVSGMSALTHCGPCLKAAGLNFPIAMALLTASRSAVETLWRWQLPTLRKRQSRPLAPNRDTLGAFPAEFAALGDAPG